ncbi:hypothetical protein BU23DRAFT_325664 [Bimuria novae-zelandiae CBS 107.79]|uniref:Calcium channel subunit Mid1 n=1 Tax=Bimuria novae-zelandiae CBS 107.79 TaxID=1447943 RepID=A0A6A5URL7_9PLEO|nr:hypothetical protein BU23DRAFT_325664 [Bimuria novae-zelandiae CBS 107.79]
MQLPKLTPLQSRLLAFSITTCLVVVLWICFPPNYFAYAAEIPVPLDAVQHSEFEASIQPAPPDDPPLETRDGIEEEENGHALYAPDFDYLDKSLIGRQDDAPTELNNNQMLQMNIMPNRTQEFRFNKSQFNKRLVLEESAVAGELEDNTNRSSRRAEDVSEESTEGIDLEKRQKQTQLWISANTCRQPAPTVILVTDSAPQLKLSVWTQAGSARANPAARKNAKNVTFDAGHVNFTFLTDEDVFVAVEAPSLTDGWDGNWNFQLAASVDEGYYHNYDNATNFIYMVDTDSDSTLFITHNLTASNKSEEVAKWQQMENNGTMPFSIYAFPDGLPKGQFHVQGLKTSTNYTGVLVMNGATNMTIDGNTVGKGGQVFQKFQWQTKADDTCQVIFGLEECSSVAYAVPSSPQWKNNDTGLIAFYDGLARTYMQNFNRSLAQVACDTASTAQYSLARTCTDCAADYKSWLCSVLIPRCEDWTATSPWVHPRNINTPFANGTLPTSDNISMQFNDTVRGRFAYNQSRNNEIDKVVKPGPYKELLPCEDLCFDIVRSCPAQMGFACPNPPMRELSYGKRDPKGLEVRCNFPGAVVDLTQDRNGAGRAGGRVSAAVGVAVLAAAWSWI